MFFKAIHIIIMALDMTRIFFSVVISVVARTCICKYSWILFLKMYMLIIQTLYLNMLIMLIILDASREHLTSGFPTRSDTKRAA